MVVVLVLPDVLDEVVVVVVVVVVVLCFKSRSLAVPRNWIASMLDTIMPRTNSNVVNFILRVFGFGLVGVKVLGTWLP